MNQISFFTYFLLMGNLLFSQNDIVIKPNNIKTKHFGKSIIFNNEQLIIGSNDSLFIYECFDSIITLKQVIKLFKSGKNIYDDLNIAVDENIMIVGSSGNNGYISIYFKKDNFFYIKYNIDRPSESSSGFGATIALKDSFLFISDVLDGIDQIGTVSIYKLYDEKYCFFSKLNDCKIKNAHFGSSISVNNNSILIGTSSGHSAYLYSFNNNNWKLQHVFNSDIGLTFGYGSCFGDDFIAISAPNNFLKDGNHSIFIYKNISGNWSQVFRINGPLIDEAWLNFGTTILYTDNFLVIGTSGEVNQYPVFLYYKNENINWNKLKVINKNVKSFGTSISINTKWLSISAPEYDDENGIVYLYKLRDFIEKQ